MPNLFYKLPQGLAARRDLTAADKIVWAILRNRIGGNAKAWPGCRKLAEDCGLNVGTVIAAIRRLENAGLIIVDRRGIGKGNFYQLGKESAWKTQALGKSKRLKKPSASAGKNQALAHGKPMHIKNKIKKRSKKARRKAATPPDPQIKKFIDWFTETYHKAVGVKYIVQGGKDGKIIKTLLQSLSLEELQRAAQNMLADPWGRDKADIGLLSSQINRWQGQGKAVKVQTEDARAVASGAYLEELATT